MDCHELVISSVRIWCMAKKEQPMIRPQGERYLWQCTQPIITFPSMNYCAASSGIKGKFSNIPAGAENCLAANVRSVPVQIVHIKVFQGQFNNLISTWAMLIVTNDNFQNLLHFSYSEAS